MDPALEGEILRTTLEMMRSTTYQRLRVVDIARRAKVGLGSIYRRWPTKADVVLAALMLRDPARERAEGDPRAELRASLVRLSEYLVGPGGRFFASLLAEFNEDAYLAERFRATVGEAHRAHYRALIITLVGNTADVDYRTDVGPGYIMMRTLVTGQQLDPAEIDRVVLPLMLDTRALPS